VGEEYIGVLQVREANGRRRPGLGMEGSIQ